MAVLVIIRSGRAPDEGAVLRIEEYGEALAFACRWWLRHPRDRVTLFTTALAPLAEFHAVHPGSAQSGRDASGTLS